MPGGAIAVASDHAGFDLKKILKRDLQEAGHVVLDLGTNSTESVDCPDFGKAMADVIAAGKAGLGVLVCGTGTGISIAANRHPKVRAALAHDVTSAKLSKG
jgi:ribose 5-phosphate isomerase B